MSRVSSYTLMLKVKSPSDTLIYHEDRVLTVCLLYLHYYSGETLNNQRRSELLGVVDGAPS